MTIFVYLESFGYYTNYFFVIPSNSLKVPKFNKINYPLGTYIRVEKIQIPESLPLLFAWL